VQCRQQNSRPSSSSSTAARAPTSAPTSAKKPYVPPSYDPCEDEYPVMDPYCYNYVASTGTGKAGAGGLSSWAIGGIVVLVVLVVAGALLFGFKRWKAGKLQAGGGEGAVKLLGGTATAEPQFSTHEEDSTARYTAA